MVHPYGCVSSSDKVLKTRSRGENREVNTLQVASKPGEGKDWIIWLTYVNIRKRRQSNEPKRLTGFNQKVSGQDMVL